jgi:hypothetical protein
MKSKPFVKKANYKKDEKPKVIQISAVTPVSHPLWISGNGGNDKSCATPIPIQPTYEKLQLIPTKVNCSEDDIFLQSQYHAQRHSAFIRLGKCFLYAQWRYNSLR